MKEGGAEHTAVDRPCCPADRICNFTSQYNQSLSKNLSQMSSCILCRTCDSVLVGNIVQLWGWTVLEHFCKQADGLPHWPKVAWCHSEIYKCFLAFQGTTWQGEIELQDAQTRHLPRLHQASCLWFKKLCIRIGGKICHFNPPQLL